MLLPRIGSHPLPVSFQRFVEQLKFTLLAIVALILPIAVSISAASYCGSIFNMSGAEFKAIESLSFFGVLAAEAVAYVKFRRWRKSAEFDGQGQP
jgi:membrane protein DedA with SNARE-associated domain